MIRSIFLGMATVSVLSLAACNREVDAPPTDEVSESGPPIAAAYSLFGKPLVAPQPSEDLLAKFAKYQQASHDDPNNADKLIWYGRFAAYKGDYSGAIEIFTLGTEKFPNDARMLRHRGHRYISTRKFDEAIVDLERATELVAGQANEIEPDGMPNARNIPVSTLHGNIWYHLGLAYYLNHDFENALRAYTECLKTSTNPDNVVSATHWLYMINRRMGRDDDADTCLDRIDPDMDIIENMNYHKCCLFYKGLMTLDELRADAEDGPAGDSIDYAIGNWHFYNGEPEQARGQFEKLSRDGNWASFGFIAAESDLASGFDSK